MIRSVNVNSGNTWTGCFYLFAKLPFLELKLFAISTTTNSHYSIKNLNLENFFFRGIIILICTYSSSGRNIFPVVIIGAHNYVAFQARSCSFISQRNVFQTCNMFPFVQVDPGVGNYVPWNGREEHYAEASLEGVGKSENNTRHLITVIIFTMSQNKQSYLSPLFSTESSLSSPLNL